MSNLFEFLNKDEQDFVVKFKDRDDLMLNVNCQKELGDAENDFCDKYYFYANIKNQNGDDLGLISFNIENKDYVFFGLIMVNKQFKTNGIGTKLVEFLEFAAQQRGIGTIIGDFDTDDPAAPIFYDKRGYKIIKTDDFEIVRKKIDTTKVDENVLIQGLQKLKEKPHQI